MRFGDILKNYWDCSYVKWKSRFMIWWLQKLARHYCEKMASVPKQQSCLGIVTLGFQNFILVLQVWYLDIKWIKWSLPSWQAAHQKEILNYCPLKISWDHFLTLLTSQIFTQHNVHYWKVPGKLIKYRNSE